MPRVIFRERAHEVAEGATVLDALLADGVALPHACRAGACGACVVRVRSGPIPPKSQVGLPATWIARGCVYACQCRPEADLTIEPPGEGLRVAGEIVSSEPLSDSVARVVVRVPEAFSPVRGQYVTLERRGVARSFSVADRRGLALELHVRRVPGGALSPYLCDEARPGDPLTVAGPFGDCVYGETAADTPLLLAGTGTGLAPLWGVLMDALAAGHRAPIWLFHGAVDPAGLYLRDELRALAAQHRQLRYIPSALRLAAATPAGVAGAPGAPGAGAGGAPHALHTPGAGAGSTPGAGPGSTPGAGAGSTPGASGALEEGPLDAIVLRHVPSTRGMRAFVCGAPDVVRALKKKIFMAGAAMRDISSDAFLPASPAPASAPPAATGPAGTSKTG